MTYRRALLATSPPGVRFLALLTLAETLVTVGEYDRGAKYCVDADSLARAMASDRAISMVFHSRGVAAARQGDFARALQLMEEAAARGAMPRRLRQDIRVVWNHLRIRVMAGLRVTGAGSEPNGGAADRLLMGQAVVSGRWPVSTFGT